MPAHKQQVLLHPHLQQKLRKQLYDPQHDALQPQRQNSAPHHLMPAYTPTPWFIDHDFEHNASMSCWKVIDDRVEIKDVLKIKLRKNVFKISVIKKEDI